MDSRQEELELTSVIGFDGNVPNGLIYHPDGEHLIYPLGSAIVIRDIRANRQEFLQGHTGKVTCLALSHDGRYLASGQETSMGFKADVIVWDVEAGIRHETEREIVHKLSLHKVSIQDLQFSKSDRFLATLGGQDDNNLVVWDVETGDAICGSPAAPDSAVFVEWIADERIVTGGKYNLRRWDFDAFGRKLNPVDCHLGNVRRIITCACINVENTLLYCGTHTGDILEVNIAARDRPLFVRATKERFMKGVRCLKYYVGERNNHILFGTGSGLIGRMPVETLNARNGKKAEIAGIVTSIAEHPDGKTVQIGTTLANRYKLPIATMAPKLCGTAHSFPINDVYFPDGCSEIFVTSSTNDVRIWNCNTRRELLRIEVKNLVCNCAVVTPNGRSVVTGWTDGKIRAFYPESGKLQYVISDAHAESVTALAVASNSMRVISGGKDGRVRVWKITPGGSKIMEYSFKEHKGPVTSLALNQDDTECVSSAADGSCIAWSLTAGVRVGAMFASTMFRCIKYHPDQSQLLSCGSDRKITYWDASDFNAIRMITASEAEIQSIDIDAKGELFVSGGNDKLVALWHYDDGVPLYVGKGHSGNITKLRISPDHSKIVSVGEEGAIFIWEMPTVSGGSADLPHAPAQFGDDDAVNFDDIRSMRS